MQKRLTGNCESIWIDVGQRVALALVVPSSSGCWCMPVNTGGCRALASYRASPEGHEAHIGITMGHVEGTMWGVRPVAVSALASVLRRWLLDAYAASELARDNGERALALHRYFTGPDFRQRMERLEEFLAEQEAELTAERKWFTQRWAPYGAAHPGCC